jgi:glycosidase
MRVPGLLTWLLIATFVRAGQPLDDGSWMARPALYEVFVRDFSPEGNFAGVQKGLDRIQATGANVIWLMPIHPIGRINKKGPIG